MPETMVERIATLLSRQAGDTRDLPLFNGGGRQVRQRLVKPAWHRYVETARMLIEAMNEPTSAMTDAGAVAVGDSCFGKSDRRDEAVIVYQAMVAAATDERDQ